MNTLSPQILLTQKVDLFRLCPPPVGYPPPVTEHVPLHSKSSRKNMARASGGPNKMYPLNWGGGTNGKRSKKCLL